MNILYLAHRIPYPPNKGDKIRSFNEVKFLAANHTVDLICLADEPHDIRYAEPLQKHCRKVFVYPISTFWSKVRGLIGLFLGRSISVGYFYRKAVQTAVNQWLGTENYDVVICFSSSMAKYIFQTNSFMAGEGGIRKRPKLIMDFCDIDSDKWLQYTKEAGFPLKQIYHAENKRLQAFEKQVYEQFDSSVMVSEQEKTLFLEICPQAQELVVIPNGVDAAYFSPDFSEPAPDQDQHPTLVFTGAMDYHANVDGVCWFSEKIYPILQERFSDLQFYIVGRNPLQTVRKLESLPGIHVVGNVADIRPWYRRADVFVVPLRLARGVQNKVLEAMAMGKAVVTTSKVNAGIAAEDTRHLMLADAADDFIAAVTELLRDNNRRKILGENARNFVLKKYGWDENLAEFETLLT